MAEHYLVPGREDAQAADITYSLVAEMIEEAEDLFVDAKDRLLDVTGWATYGSLSGIQFQLADNHEHLVKRHARRGDHILISKQGSSEPNSLDCFTIDALEYDDYPDDNLETFAIRMHPSKQPATADGSRDNTATIVVERAGTRLSAIYHGRRITGNTDDAWHILNERQWVEMMKGLLEYFG
jgi:hypothetical protein